MERTILAYNFKNTGNDETEISIYDKIASKKSKNWDGSQNNEVTPDDFKEQLMACKTKNITIRMNSCGGEVSSANVIAVAIQEARQAGKNIICKVDGMCASAAVQIAMACEKVIMHKSALMMIHNPMIFLFDYVDVNRLKTLENMLVATKDSIISYYTEKTGMSKDEISEMMDVETYMTGEDAVEKGFADSLMFDDEASEEDVIENISQMYAVNQALNIPTHYMSAINNISLKKGANPEMEIKTVEDLVKEFPELTNQLVAGAIEDHIAKNPVNQTNTADAVTAERERIKAIDEMAGKVDNDLLTKAKYETFATAENVAMEAIKTGAFVQSQVLNAMQTETAVANNVAGIEPPAGAGNEKKSATEKASSVAENYLKSIGKAVK